MRALVLFTGTGSVDRALERAGFVVDSLDINPKCKPTWCCNIMDWDDWRKFDIGEYDFVWSSPPCQQYSIARTTAKTPRDLEGSDRIVQRTLEIIRHIRPKGWLMENPASGYLKTREPAQGLPWRDVCYCMYSDGEKHTYRKQTRLWGHLPTLEPRNICTKKSPCPWSKDTGKHPTTAQRFTVKGMIKPCSFTLNQLYSMPEALCDDIAGATVKLMSDPSKCVQYT